MLRKMNPLTDDVNKIAKLIYETDDALFDFLFGDQAKSISILNKLIPNKGTSFSYQHIWVYEYKFSIAGIVVAYANDEMHDDLNEFRKTMTTIRFIHFMFHSFLLRKLTNTSAYTGIYLQNVCIDQTLRGHGLGARMLEEFCLYFKNSFLFLDASQDKLHLHRFYKRLGFTIDKRINLSSINSGVFRMIKRR